MLGHLCHVTPAEVDGLDLADFAALAGSIDAYLKK